MRINLHALKNIQEEEYLAPIHPNLVYAFLRKDDRLEGEIRYPSLYYRESTVSKLAEPFSHLLAAGLDNLDAPVDAVEMLTGQERQRLLVEFNRSEAPFPGDKTIHELVRLQVEQTRLIQRIAEFSQLRRFPHLEDKVLIHSFCHEIAR